MSKKIKKRVTKHLTVAEKVASGVIMTGLLVKKGKRSYVSSARHCVLTRDSFIYSSGLKRHIPILNIQVSVARESFTLVDCSDESFTFRVLGKVSKQRESKAQEWAQAIIRSRDSLKLVKKAVLKQGKGRDRPLVNTWLTDRTLITAEPTKTGATVILLRTITELVPVPLEPALVMHTIDGKRLQLSYATETHQRNWLHILTEYVRLSKLNASNNKLNQEVPQDINAEMELVDLANKMKTAVVKFYKIYASQKVSRVDEYLENYEGRERTLFSNLEKKYGARPDFDLLPIENARHMMNNQQYASESNVVHGTVPPPIPKIPTRLKKNAQISTKSHENGVQSLNKSFLQQDNNPVPSKEGSPATTPTFKAPHEQKCNCCFRAFTFTTRRHHCRCCNRAVCHSCSGMREATERMRALTSVPPGAAPGPALMKKLANISLSKLNPTVQREKIFQAPKRGPSHWGAIKNNWTTAMNEGIKIRICDGCLEETQNDLMECWDALSIRPQVAGILDMILEQNQTQKAELEQLL